MQILTGKPLKPILEAYLRLGLEEVDIKTPPIGFGAEFVLFWSDKYWHPVGFMIFDRNPTRIYFLFVLKEVRCEGMATIGLQKFLSLLKVEGERVVVCCPVNTSLDHILKRLGYTRTTRKGLNHYYQKIV